jgi:hypothetical protein
MLFKCSFCQRTFSRRTAYTQHKNRCLLTVESSEESSEYEKNTLEIKKIKKFSKKNESTPKYSEIINNQLNSNSENYKNVYDLVESTQNDYNNDFDILVSIILKNYNFKIKLT